LSIKCVYTKEGLKWYALCPGYYPELFISLRNKDTKKIIACIFGVVVKIKVNEKIIQMVEINLLAIDKKLREKRLATYLIEEVTRRVSLTGIVNAIYSGTLDLPNKLVSVKFYHRPLNFKKLNDYNYFPDKITKNISLYDKLYKPKDTNYKFRLITKKDIPICLEHLNNKLKKLKVTRIFDKESFEHYFISRDNIIYTYIYEVNGKITDMISYYIIDQQIENNKIVKIANLFYYFNNSLEIADLINSILYIASNNKIDMFNIHNSEEFNTNLLDKYKFKLGSVTLNYHFYNYKYNKIDISEIYYPIY
jgi:glycylpeptide N-tetradecanoyltransferase